ncbi:MAG TPA: hypothetical protein VF806_00290 [Anaerolineaceae bacterium]
MVETSIRVEEICHPGDPLLLDWLDLYEQAFPPFERVLVSRVLRQVAMIERGQETDNHILAAVDASSRLVGLMWIRKLLDMPVAFLWYFATVPEVRGLGMGAEFYRWLLRFLQPDVQALVYDVEDPRLLAAPEKQEIARRRIAFYQRQGARLIGGIRYIASVAPYKPGVEGRLMAHPLVDGLSVQDALALAQPTLGDWITPVGEIRWE